MEVYLMKSIIERLENHISNMGLTVLEKRDDGFAYSIAIDTENGVFVIFTTKSFMKYHKNQDSYFRVIVSSKYLPFTDVTPWDGGDFIMPYMQTLIKNGYCKTHFEMDFTIEELTVLLKS